MHKKPKHSLGTTAAAIHAVACPKDGLAVGAVKGLSLLGVSSPYLQPAINGLEQAHNWAVNGLEQAILSHPLTTIHPHTAQEIAHTSMELAEYSTIPLMIYAWGPSALNTARDWSKKTYNAISNIYNTP